MILAQKGFVSLLTLILFIILIGSFVWAVFYFRQQPINQELPRPLQESMPAEEKKPEASLVYSNKNLGFYFNYPTDWQVKEVIVQNDKILHSLLELKPNSYSGQVIPIKLLSIDNPTKLSLEELDKKLIVKKNQAILYSIDDVYMLTGSGLAVSFRNEGDCQSQKCQIYTFSRDAKVYQLVSLLDAGVFNQRDIFDQIINSFRFDNFSQPEPLGVSTTASPR